MCVCACVRVCVEEFITRMFVCVWCLCVKSWYVCTCTIVHFKRVGSRHIHKEIDIS